MCMHLKHGHFFTEMLSTVYQNKCHHSITLSRSFYEGKNKTYVNKRFNYYYLIFICISFVLDLPFEELKDIICQFLIIKRLVHPQN